jgi:hypothetical protein
MKYTITHKNGNERQAGSMALALIAARELMGVSRIYLGAEYLSDREEGDDLISITCLDIWPSGRQAEGQSHYQADVVISCDGTLRPGTLGKRAA